MVPSDPAEWIDAAVRRTIGPEEIVDEDLARAGLLVVSRDERLEFAFELVGVVVARVIA